MTRPLNQRRRAADLESEVSKRVLLATSETDIRLFRNNIGVGWVGRSQRLHDGSILIHDPRPLHAGLHDGSGDLIGWSPITITPDMVGRTVAVFTSIEVKSATGRVTSGQQHWIDQVNHQGGIAGVARGGDQALEIIRGYRYRETEKK